MKRSSGLPKIKRSMTLEELVYEHVKEAILNGTFRPGEFLPEVQVAQELGISKTPVRKAMGRLQQERFLVNIPFEGYYVAEISAQDIVEIYQLRQILECHLVQETALLFTPAELDELEAILQAADKALAQSDSMAFVEHNREFHHAFDRRYGNQRISDLLTNLDEHVHRILLHEFSVQQSDLAASHSEHYLILGHVREADVEAAVYLMHQHLARFRDTLVARMQDGPRNHAKPSRN